jgi:hypothetical protein
MHSRIDQDIFILLTPTPDKSDLVIPKFFKEKLNHKRYKVYKIIDFLIKTD